MKVLVIGGETAVSMAAKAPEFVGHEVTSFYGYAECIDEHSESVVLNQTPVFYEGANSLENCKVACISASSQGVLVEYLHGGKEIYDKCFLCEDAASRMLSKEVTSLKSAILDALPQSARIFSLRWDGSLQNSPTCSARNIWCEVDSQAPAYILQVYDVERNQEVVATILQTLQDYLPGRDSICIKIIELMERSVKCFEQLYGDKTKPPGKLWMHFWVRIETECGKTFSFEKIKSGTLCCGVEMYFLITEVTGRVYGISRAKTTLEGVEVKITELQEKINERGKVKYAVFHHNCWEFASGLAMDIVDLCLSDAVRASATDKASLAIGKKRLQEKERPSPSDCMRLLFSWLINDAKNLATTEKLMCRITEHINNCEHCHLHRVLKKPLSMRPAAFKKLDRWKSRIKHSTSLYAKFSAMVSWKHEI